MTQETAQRLTALGGKFQSLWAPVVQVEVEQPQEEPLSTAVDAAYRKGYEEGMSSAEASFAELLQRERRSFEAEVQRSIEVRHLAAVQELSESVAEQIALASAQIGDALARSLCPLVVQRLTELEYDELMSALKRIVDLKGLLEITIEGPEQFLQSLSERLEAQGLKVVRASRNDADLVVRVEDTELRSALPLWLARLEDIFK